MGRTAQQHVPVEQVKPCIYPTFGSNVQTYVHVSNTKSADYEIDSPERSNRVDTSHDKGRCFDIGASGIEGIMGMRLEETSTVKLSRERNCRLAEVLLIIIFKVYNERKAN